MKKQLNEIKRMQQLAGLLKEADYSNIMIGTDDYDDSEEGVGIALYDELKLRKDSGEITQEQFIDAVSYTETGDNTYDIFWLLQDRDLRSIEDAVDFILKKIGDNATQAVNEALRKFRKGK